MVYYTVLILKYYAQCRRGGCAFGKVVQLELWCSNPERGKPQSLKEVITTPL